MNGYLFSFLGFFLVIVRGGGAYKLRIRLFGSLNGRKAVNGYKEPTMTIHRRDFLLTFAGAALAGWTARSLAAEPSAGNAGPASPARPPLMGNRFLTFNTVIRVNQIEVTRNRNAGGDEAGYHTPEIVQAFRDAFEQGWPGGRMTWAMSWRALQDQRPNYKAIRKRVVEYHRKYGDEITFLPGGYFANMYNTREQINQDLHDALAMVSEMVGNGYRPRSVLAGFLAAENQRYLAEQEAIHVCQGNIWSQYAVDNGDGDGAICYPYYPSREHFCKPAQGNDDFIDCVNLDGWSCDFISARRPGATASYNSRMGVGPIETLAQGRGSQEGGLAHMLATTAQRFDRGFELNGFAWVTNCWELCLVKQFEREGISNSLQYLTRWLSEIRKRWPQALCITQGEFGLAWRDHFKDNAKLDYRFVARGSGFGGSEDNLEIRWFMNKDFRLALLRDWKANGPEKVIDFTRYDLKAQEPREKGRNWSLMNRINQKGLRPQDKPIPLAALPEEDQALIRQRYPELFRASQR